MPEGPSATAARVAAYRLGFERIPAPYGDPAADEALARDVAGDPPAATDELMARYLRGRTAFFDRVVVNALDRGVTQVVSVGAGYDGRAWRYRKAGTRWWEVDHPATQSDKTERLGRLAVASEHVAFVGHDLREAGLAKRLVEAGFEPDAPALLLCEGVISYLDAATARLLLGELRSLATPGTRLAVSLRAGARRERLEATVAALGEPLRSSLDGESATELWRETRWNEVELSGAARDAGFVVLAPAWEAVARDAVASDAVASDAGAATLGRIGRFVERTLARAGTDTLAAHLEATYGVAVVKTRELDVGVHRVERADGSRWVARVFPAGRPVEAVREEAQLLGWLAAQGIPAESPAADGAVSVHEGQPVLVTTFVPGRPPAGPPIFEMLGNVLGRLHALPPGPPASGRPGGAWHHLVLDAGPAGEIAAARELLHDARHRVPAGGAGAYRVLADALADADGCGDLPAGLVHPDPVPRNAVGAGAGMRLVDWTGAGAAPRLVSLGCLLWSAGGRVPCVRAAMAGYGAAASLEPAEVERLPAAMRLRPLVLACWTFATGRGSLDEVVRRWEAEIPKLAAGARAAGAAVTTRRRAAGPGAPA